MRRALLLMVLFATASTLAYAERLVSFGEGQAVQLGTSLNHFREIFPQAVRGDNWENNDTVLATYTLKPPLSVDADQVRFFFHNNLLVQIDHRYSAKRAAERGGWQFDYDAFSQLFGSPGEPVKNHETYTPRVKYAFTWKGEQTGEGASLDVYLDGSSLVSFNVLPGRHITDLPASSAPAAGPVSGSTTPESPVLFSPTHEGAAIDRAKANRPPNQIIRHQPGEYIDRALKANRPPNGTVFLQTSTQGQGELNIDNGTKFDAWVKLVSPQRKYTFISVYIHSGRSATVRNIRPNTYKLVYALGEGWDESGNSMVGIASTAAFTKLLTFIRSKEQYSTIKVTLHPVADGNTQSIDISKDEFLAY